MKLTRWPWNRPAAQSGRGWLSGLWEKTKQGFAWFLPRIKSAAIYAWDYICHFAHEITELRPTSGMLALSLLLIFVLCGVVCLPNASAMLQIKQVTLQRDDTSVLLETRAGTVADLLSDMQLNLQEGDVLSPALNENLSDGDTVRLASAKHVSVYADGQTRQVRMLYGSVAQALELSGVRLGEDDIVSPDLDSQIRDGMQIAVSRVTIRMETEEQGIPYQEVYVEESSLYKGETELSRQGSEGVRELQIRVVLQDGVETERSVVGERILEPAVNRIIYKGTKVRPTPTPKPPPKPSSGTASTPKPSSSAGSSGSSSSGGGKASTVKQGPKGSYSDDEIQMAAKLAYLEAKGTGSDGYKAVVNVLINRCNSSQFGGSIEKEIFRSNQFTVANNRERFLSTSPDSKSVAAAEAVLLNGERLLPSDVLFFRTARAGKEWGKRTYYATIGANSFFK